MDGWILLCTIRSRGSRTVSRTEPDFFISLFNFFMSLALMLLSQQMSRWDCTLHNRLIEDLQNHAANTEGLKLPEEVKSVLSPSPVRSVVQLNTEVFILLHHLRFFPHDVNYLILSPKIHNNLFCHFSHSRWDDYATKQSTSYVHAMWMAAHIVMQ